MTLLSGVSVKYGMFNTWDIRYCDANNMKLLNFINSCKGF
jgi:hypothetical protein